MLENPEPAGSSAAPAVIPVPGSTAAPLRFLILENNDGAYHWTIVADSGETLVRSVSFSTYDEAVQAARTVHAGVPSASLEHSGGDAPPADLAASAQVGAV